MMKIMKSSEANIQGTHSFIHSFGQSTEGTIQVVDEKKKKISHSEHKSEL